MIEKLSEKYDKYLTFSMNIFRAYENSNITPFKDSFTTFNGGTFKSKDYVTTSNNKLITIKNVDDYGFNTSSVSYLKDDIADEKYLLNIGDIILTMTGNIGRTGIVDENYCYLNQRVLKINSTSKLYLFCYLTKYKKEIINLGKGTAQLNLSLDDLNKLKVFNSINEICAFKKYDVLFQMMLNIKLSIRKLNSIKQILLSKYF